MSSKKLINEIGINLKKLRLDKAKGQTEVARALGISMAALSKIENGLTDLNISRLAQLAKYFEVPITTILFKDQAGATVAQHVIVEIEALQKQLADKEAEVVKLQKKVIDLYEKLGL